MSELVLGIDEAGRGPIIGPMVMAAVALRPRRSAALTRAGVADSKSYVGDEARAQRASLFALIMEAADHVEWVVIEREEIDIRCRSNGLNRLEQERAGELIGRAPPCKRIVCDGERLFAPLKQRFAHLEARDEGESHHVAVAAASIVAKVHRDEAYLKIAERYAADFGELPLRGGGYVNAATRAFLRAYIERHRALPPEARRSWPWEFARDLLGEAFDVWHDVPGGGPPRQMNLL